MRTAKIRLFCFIVAASFQSLAVQGADLSGNLKDTSAAYVPTATNPWEFSFTTYGWLTWISGAASVKGRPVTIDVTPSNVLMALDWSQIPVWMSYFEARNGRLSLFNDIVYAKLEGSEKFARPAQRGPTAVSLGGRIEADFEQAVVEFGAGYEIWSSRSNASGLTALDIVGGGRYWHQNLSVSADANATLAVAGPGGIVDLERKGSRVIARSRSIDWVDPFVGARLRHHFAPGQVFNLRGDLGGFGVGSEFTWQAMATIDWQLLRRSGYTFDAYIGYRALSVDYSKGNGVDQYRFSATQHGPVIGGALRF